MSTETPSSTPLKKLPMIVDIAIDPSGAKMYQVHETSKPFRKEMPLSTNFSRSTLTSTDDLRSPVDSVMGTFSPCSEEMRAPVRPAPDGARKFSDPGSYTVDTPTSTNGDEDNIWGKDVQAAFEEVLAIVPKNGLNKIKIAGKLCGRNELISDYILAKTGKYRTRKQVLSHIQVIKNMGLKKFLIQLINDGPMFASREELDENTRKFEEIFSKINMNKSLGVNSIHNANGPLRRHSLAAIEPSPKRRRLPSQFVGVKNICFSIDNLYVGLSPIILSVLEDAPVKLLTVKENAAISNRFPGLEEFSNTAVPVVHNMVKIFSPLLLPSNFSIDSGLKTNYMLEFSSPHAQLASFTTVYLFGNEVLKVNEDDFQCNVNQPFLLKFWKCFFLQLLHLPPSLDTAFKGITVKQVIYDSDDTSSSIVPKHKIKAVLLWEFCKVANLRDAVSSTSRLFLPPSLGYSTIDNFHAKTVLPHASSHFTTTSQDTDPLYAVEAMANPYEPDLLSGYHGVSNQPSYYPAQYLAPYQVPYLAVFHPSANVDLATIRSGHDELQFAGPY